MKPRLLCLMQLPPPVHGAAVVNQVVANSKVLASHFEIDVLPLAFARSSKDIEHPSLRKLLRMVGTGVRLAYTLMVRPPAAVYFTLAPTRYAFYRDCVFIALIKIAGVPRIYHLHGKGIGPQRAAMWRRLLYAWAFRDAWVIHLSESLLPDIEGLVPRSRMKIVPNGIAARKVPARITRIGRPRLLYLSNMIESKGPLVLLEALGLLRARGIEFEATFAGAASSDRIVEEFAATLTRLDLGSSVRYVGAAYDEHKYRLLDEHDIFVFPTSNDAFPLVALEAMQAGLPVVTTYEGALPEIVEDGTTGMLVPARNPLALADRLASLLGDMPMQRRMGARAKVRQEQRYTLVEFEQNLATALVACTNGAHAHLG